jgi:MFS family permease
MSEPMLDGTDRVRAPATGPAAHPPVGARFLLLLALVVLALFMAFGAVVQVLLPNQVQALGPAGKEAGLALVLTLGALVATVAVPLFGALSDRTTARSGPRRPWLVGGAVTGAGALLVLSRAGDLRGVVLGWMLCQLTLAAVSAAVMALIPDRVPRSRRGMVSAVVGLAQVLGPVVGIALVTAVPPAVGVQYAALGAALLLAAAVLAAGLPEQRRPQPPPFAARAFVAGFWVSPRRHPDFAWAWITRFLVVLGYSLVVTYLLYFLRDEVRYESTVGGRAEDGVLLLNAVSGAALLVTIVAGGVLSDRLQRRKPFVIVSTVVIALGPLALAVAPGWPTAVAAAVALGAGFGVYLAVDVALITEVLPAADSHAKDLGVISIANTLPQTAAPALAGVLVTVAGYPALFATAAVVALLGAVLVRPITSVR